MESAVDAAFGVHPVQNICGFPANDNLRNQPVSVELKGASLRRDFTAAMPEAANDNDYQHKEKHYGS